MWGGSAMAGRGLAMHAMAAAGRVGLHAMAANEHGSASAGTITGTITGRVRGSASTDIQLYSRQLEAAFRCWNDCGLGYRILSCERRVRLICGNRM